jgi:Sulfotransferase domain
MSQSSPLRIAMWSGPRNISTAMMRAWGNRADTIVCDEPLYAYYLKMTGKPHPGADEVIARHEADWRKVVAWLTGPIPGDKPIFYQKHMTHHLLPDVSRHWLGEVTNCFLIRDPREVITSYIAKNDDPTLEDVGFVQQVAIFDWVRRHTGAIPPVLDARDVLENPRRLLGLLCDALHIPFRDEMLSWAPGPRETDGVWARHWYKEVETSTSFRTYQPKTEPVPERLAGIHRRCLECYEQLAAHRLR